MPAPASPRPVLLLTRPRAQSLRFAAQVRERFQDRFDIVISPLTEIVFLDVSFPEARTLVFTSESGVAAYAARVSDRSALAWCVGPRTEAAARAAGFRTCEGPGDGAGLARAVTAAGADEPVLYVRGTHAARDIVAELAASGLMATEVVAYDQPALSLSDEANAALSEAGLLMLPLFSPRAAKLASAVLAPAHATLAVVAISATVAKAAATLAPAQIVVAERPDADAMLEALGAVSLPA